MCVCVWCVCVCVCVRERETNSSFADDKAPEDLILQMQVLNLLENKIICST